eukprot:TRINITY_DN30858_c0_g1_i1.p2 TRINITY_DN30858_c0_g1~~TRINITY_DN30858_c0_g1_i1.p2  ORF type:complete len:183 (+),score=8.07 TRINITY_DN30858_c0_g1_i1:53-550(+)
MDAQIYFFPGGDFAIPSSYTAFCPFTGIIAEGKSLEESARNWRLEVKFDSRFDVRQSHVRSALKSGQVHRKVWVGVQPGTDNTVYIMNADVRGGAVAFCPETGQSFIGDFGDFITEQGDCVKFMPSLLVELSVACTRLCQIPLRCSAPEPSGDAARPSLTPHCIN